MDSILSTVLSAFTNNPIFVLAIIAYIVFSFLKSSKTEDADEYETSGAEKTWEDMEREYGIPIERKIEEPSVNATSNDVVYQSSNTQISYNQSAEQPKKEEKKEVKKTETPKENNEEVEKVFIDYIVYHSDNKEDPILNIINSYWEENNG